VTFWPADRAGRGCWGFGGRRASGLSCSHASIPAEWTEQRILAWDRPRGSVGTRMLEGGTCIRCVAPAAGATHQRGHEDSYSTLERTGQ